jgi:hypothetical protein
MTLSGMATHLNGSEDAALQCALCEGIEEALDRVEPGGRSRREVEGPARMARQPFAYGGMLVGGVIVEDCMDDLSGRNLALDGIQEPDEFLMAMALHVVADHGSVEDVDSCEQGGRSVPLIIMVALSCLDGAR